MNRPSALLLALFGAVVHGANINMDVEANPIRKVVTLMQNMQSEIEAEGDKDKELYDKFMCFCENGEGQLRKTIDEATAKIEELGAKLKASIAEKQQNAADLKDHQSDREGAKQDIAQATSLRQKENDEFEALAADSKANIAAMGGAIPALEKGMGASSLVQMPWASRLKSLAQSSASLERDDRRAVMAFFGLDSSEESPPTGQIVGILKSMKDEFETTLKASTQEEVASVASFESLMNSKASEIALASSGVESKTARAGDLAVTIVQTKDALNDYQEELVDATKFVSNLDSQCATKQKEWAEITELRNNEIKAISEAISILNDDDARDVFKKALPSALTQTSVGFLQHTSGRGTRASLAHKAQAILAGAAGKYATPQLKLLLYTLTSKLKMNAKGTEADLLGNFGEVIKMIDDMVALLGKQQDEDDKQKDWCRTEFNTAEDEQRAAQSKKDGIAAAMEEMSDTIAQMSEEIDGLSQDIKDLDKDVAEATEQRKLEHAEYLTNMQMNSVATELVEKAKNRMNKFYNPDLVSLIVTRDSQWKKAAVALVQISSVQESSGSTRSHLLRVEPPAAPESPGAFKKSGQSAGVLGLMDMIIKDLMSSSKDVKFEEQTAQTDYNKLMGSSADSRAANAKAITNKEAAKADVESKLDEAKESHRNTVQDLQQIKNYINDLHVSCDFIQENFDVRKEARANELDSLKNAKAVLSGANFGS